MPTEIINKTEHFEAIASQLKGFGAVARESRIHKSKSIFEALKQSEKITSYISPESDGLSLDYDLPSFGSSAYGMFGYGEKIGLDLNFVDTTENPSSELQLSFSYPIEHPKDKLIFNWHKEKRHEMLSIEFQEESENDPFGFKTTKLQMDFTTGMFNVTGGIPLSSNGPIRAVPEINEINVFGKHFNMNAFEYLPEENVLAFRFHGFPVKGMGEHIVKLPVRVDIKRPAVTS